MNIYFWNKRSLEMEKVSYFKIIPIIVGILGIITCLLVTTYNSGFDSGKRAEIMEKDVIVLYQEVENTSFTRRIP